MKTIKELNINLSTNKITLICYSIITSVLAISYFIEVRNGNRTLQYYIAFLLVTLVPLAIGWIYYYFRKISMLLRYLIIIGYCLMYTFVLFTGSVVNVFVHIMPMLIVITVYSDLKATAVFNAYAVIVNIAQVLYLYKLGKVDAELLVNIKIQLAAVLLVSIFSLLASRLTSHVNHYKNAQVIEEKEKVTKILMEVLEISKQVTDVGQIVTEKMESLESTLHTTAEAMNQVNVGTNETANTIQNQIEETDAVMEQVNQLISVSETISGSVNETKKSIAAGNGNIESLRNNISSSETASGKLVKGMEHLKEDSDKMYTIVETIQNVADQTSLLALNASIEAARAGDTGKGFAVVAGEITNLANQTKSATLNITDLINSISAELSDVVESTEQFMRSTKSQGELAFETIRSFQEISESTKKVDSQSEFLSNAVSSLSRVNSQIVSSIQTISSIMEEVAAQATETHNASHENISTVKNVSQLVHDLNEMANAMSDGGDGAI